MDAAISIIKNVKESIHFHPETELLFVLEGYMEVTIKSQIYVLGKEQFLAVNANCMHETMSKSGTMLCAIRVPGKIFNEITHKDDFIIDINRLYIISACGIELIFLYGI